MSENQYYIVKIIQYLNDETNQTLKEEIMQWRFLNDANEQLYQQILFLWNTSRDVKNLEYLDSESSFLRLSEKMGYPYKAPRKISPWYYVAASLFLCLFVGWLYQRQTEVHYSSIVTGANADSIILVDGSRINLAPYSSLKFPDKFTEGKREVYLDYGNAFFRVAKKNGQPFVVNLELNKVTVLGTSFNISNNKELIAVAVRTGMVRFSEPGGANLPVLTVGDKLTFNKSLRKVIIERNNAENDYSWLTHVLSFNDTSLKDVFNSLSKYYQVDFVFGDSLDTYNKFNAAFKNNSLKEVIQILEETYPLSFIREGNRVYVRKKK